MNIIKKIKPILYILLALAASASVIILHNILFVFLSYIFNITKAPILEWLLSADNYNRFDILKYPLMILLFYFLYKKISNKQAKPDVSWDLKKGIIFSIILGIGFGGISFLWINFAQYALSGVKFIRESLEIMDYSNKSYSQGAALLLILAGGILGPVMEELLFRGIVFGLLEKVKKGWFAVFFSALLFGIAHMTFVQSVYTFIMGFIAGTIYLKTRNILWPVIMHITINTVASLSSFSQFQSYLGVLEKFTVIMTIPLLIIVYKAVKSRKKINLKNTALDYV